MDDDFPAAHSHDVRWFTVDRAGHVAIFWSGAMGHSPEIAENADLAEELWRLRHPSEGPLSWRESRDLPARLGFFFYEYGQSMQPVARLVQSIGPYSLIHAPPRPLHLDELPPEFRERCKRIRFEFLDFTTSQSLQPLENYGCIYRYKAERVAYLCGDGKTVRPIPGRENDFPAFYQDFREQFPDQVKDLIFTGIADETKGADPESLKENDDGK
jgi:hypothetical protein